MSEQAQYIAENEELEETREKLRKAVKLLRGVTRGTHLRDTCQCDSCEARRFLNEFV